MTSRRGALAAAIAGIAALSWMAIAVAAALAAGSRSGSSLLLQSRQRAEAGSRGCLTCHAGIEPMHASPAVQLGCVDCHGGDPAAAPPSGAVPGDPAYESARARAHVLPLHPERWPRRPSGAPSSANPERAYTLTLEESPEFIRFVNPGDLRVAAETCGPCHLAQVNRVLKSPMTTSAIFWAAAAYANGIVGQKAAFLGESYGRDGGAQAIAPATPPSSAERSRGALAALFPLPRWEIVQPGEYFRAFERGGLLQPSSFPDVGNPNPSETAGKPDIRLSSRGPGTGLRISPGVLNLHKTRLNDPHLSFLGTNDHPGDYRSSGCTACHVVYANDRDPLHSGPYAAFGHSGTSATGDATIPRGEAGHPIRHRLTSAVPSSQCMSCHMHQPNSFLNTYLGYTMWDYETDGEAMWPKEQRYPTAAERRASLDRNPEAAAARGLWSDPTFLDRVSELNPRLSHTQFADYHGHGWIFRAVYKQDRKGRLLDAGDRVVGFDDPERFKKAVHLRDVHLEKGMHCVDCHFSGDAHGDGLLHGEYGDAIEIGCEDCHGTVRGRASLRTSGPAAPPGGSDMTLGLTPDGRRRFVWRGGRLLQRSMLDPGREWEVVQVLDSITPGNPHYSERSRLAKTLLRDGRTWGQVPADGSRLAHADSDMTCYSCHSAWMTSCFGCHLPQEANQKSPMNHYEGTVTRNYASYNPQVVRTDVFMLGRNGTVKGGKVAPVRSSSALILSSINASRERFYLQQPPISAPGLSSQAFNPHVPHTVRARETKGCTDCHLSAAGDNDAWMAQLLTQGTGFVNFMGRYAWVGEGRAGLEAVAVAEADEPQAVVGSYLHRLAYPDFYRAHERRGLELPEAHHHGARAPGGEVLSLQLRGEYLYTAQGRGGLVVYDVAGIDNKDASERVLTAPVSPLGQRIRVPSRAAAAVALPATMPMAPLRHPDPANREPAIPPIYRYAFVADREEGLILVDVSTLTDGDPANNFLSRALAFNPGGALAGARGLAVAGDTVYVAARSGLVVVDCSRPLAPRIVATVSGLHEPAAVAVQFRYAYVADADGLAVVDVTDPAAPRLAARASGFGAATSVYLARTYAYLAAGPRGVAIVDVERPEHPALDRLFDAGGRLTDVRDVKVAATDASLFAYVAGGSGGLAVLQLTSPEATPGYLGFSPRPAPRLIAVRHTRGPALALSRGLDRDRAADESGHQVSVFNRLGARPLNAEETRRLYLRDGELYRVRDEPPGPPAGATKKGAP
ncbi:MAG TPA: multiheme c-type cytochrome [Thermoanaerobaculia bacterium]